MTPQKAFAENLHFWIFPFILVILKILFDVLPRIVFIVLFSVGIGIFFTYDKYSAAQKTEEAAQLEKSADALLEELNESERLEEEAKEKKRLLKEKKKEDRIRQQELRQKKNAASSPVKSSQEAAQHEDQDDEEDDDDMLRRIANNKKRR